jgi:hypothetical protein
MKRLAERCLCHVSSPKDSCSSAEELSLCEACIWADMSYSRKKHIYRLYELQHKAAYLPFILTTAARSISTVYINYSRKKHIYRLY